jgi:multiple sugar transport system ATP-binding protein
VTHDQVEAMTLGDRIVVMNAGLVQQQGTPEELFKQPVNKFVAGFIGSPTMNFILGELTEIDGTVHVVGDGYSLPLDPEMATKMADVKDRKIELGVRPSSFTSDGTGAGRVELRVVVSEYLGAQSVLVAMCGDQEVLVETASATPIKGGTTQEFGVRVNELMLFDPVSGLRF